MSEFPVTDKIRNMALLRPDLQQSLARPQVKSIICELEMTRETAEAMFNVMLPSDEETVVITEILRPAKPGEGTVFFHSGAGVGFCVDHYELNGDRL